MSASNSARMNARRASEPAAKPDPMRVPSIDVSRSLVATSPEVESGATAQRVGGSASLTVPAKAGIAFSKSPGGSDGTSSCDHAAQQCAEPDCSHAQVQSMDSPGLRIDAAEFVRAVRAAQLASAPRPSEHCAVMPPPPGWTPPRRSFDRHAVDSQPEDPNDAAGWARWLRTVDERGITSYRKFCWVYGQDRKERRSLLRFALVMGFPAGLCAAMGLIPLRQRCGAWARQAGRPCLNWAGVNGRCRFHGGRAIGSPRGSQNALKHGRYSAEARRERYAAGRTEANLADTT